MLQKLDRNQLCDFIREECANDRGVMQRFLALGAGALFVPKSTDYQSRIRDIIEEFEGRHGYVEYSMTFDLNRAVCKILDEADVAMNNHKWDVAAAILEGAATMGEDILHCGDDSAGELGSIVEECFEKWHILCNEEFLPQKIKSRIFDLALKYFTDGCLKGFDWWWDWIKMAITLADTPEKQERTITVLDNIINTKGNGWSIKYNMETAQRYKLEIISKSGTPEQQRKFMYENVGNPDFRRRLLQMAWDNGNYDEVVCLTKDGVSHDSEYQGLVKEWQEWELKAYRHKNDKVNTLKLSRYFFIEGSRFGEKEYSMETMYALMQSIVPIDEWNDFVGTLIKEASEKKNGVILLFIYTQEKMWDRYMAYLRNAPSVYNLDDAPRQVWKLYKDELIRLYALCVRHFFQRASNRNSYCEGVGLLRKLIKYGGKAEVEKIINELRTCKPRRPALLDELTKL